MNIVIALVAAHGGAREISGSASLGQAARAFQSSAAQPGVDQSLSRPLQSASCVPYGWRPRAARVVLAPDGYGVRDPPRGFDRARAGHAGHRGGHAVAVSGRISGQLPDGDAGIFPADRRAGGRTLGGIPESSRDRAPGRRHAHRLCHAVASRHTGRCARESRAHAAR